MPVEADFDLVPINDVGVGIQSNSCVVHPVSSIINGKTGDSHFISRNHDNVTFITALYNSVVSIFTNQLYCCIYNNVFIIGSIENINSIAIYCSIRNTVAYILKRMLQCAIPRSNSVIVINVNCSTFRSGVYLDSLPKDGDICNIHTLQYQESHQH